jgi:hypothetical protein
VTCVAPTGTVSVPEPELKGPCTTGMNAPPLPASMFIMPLIR